MAQVVETSLRETKTNLSCISKNTMVAEDMEMEDLCGLFH